MKTTDLMIGDIIKYNDEFVCVADIGSAVCIADYLVPTGHENAKYSAFYNRVMEVVSMFTPVPLTDDILKLNGWQFGTNGEWKKKNCLIELETGDEGGYYIYVGNVRVFIDSVHSLQHILRLAGLKEKADNFKII